MQVQVKLYEKNFKTEHVNTLHGKIIAQLDNYVKCNDQYSYW